MSSLLNESRQEKGKEREEKGKENERKGKERKEKERKGKERKEREGKQRKGKEREGKQISTEREDCATHALVLMNCVHKFHRELLCVYVRIHHVWTYFQFVVDSDTTYVVRKFPWL